MQSIAIVGVGLIGGSLGLALRQAGFTGEILGVSSQHSIAKAIDRRAIDRGVSLSEAAAVAQVIYLSQPIGGILSTLDQLGPIVRPGCLVTDAGSTKLAIVERARTALPPGMFLGGHPMAGKESRGIEAADADLFRSRTYVFTPVGELDDLTPAASAFIKWTQMLGCRTFFLSPAEHDRVVALTSHLPQLLSTALGSVLAHENLTDQQLSISGSGLRDMTRLALSSYDIWADIVGTNTNLIEHAIQVYIDKLTEVRDNLQTQHLGEMFQVGADQATKIRR